MSWSRSVAFVVGLAVFAGLGAGNVWAAPFRGIGHAPLDNDARPRTTAIGRARAQALQSALDAVTHEVAVDADARAKVLRNVSVWTGAYRVLTQGDDGATVTVELEVEIDTQRLRKHISASPLDKGGPSGFVLGSVEAPAACHGLPRRAVLAQELTALGALARNGRRLTLAIDCYDLGAIRHTPLHGARIHLRARVGTDPVAAAEAAGFADSVEDAREVALHDAVAELAAQLQRRARGQVDVIVRKPHPATRVRRLQRAVSRSVVGVRRVELVGIEPDGSVRLRVTGSLGLRELGPALVALSPTGFSVTIAEIHGDDAITIELD